MLPEETVVLEQRSVAKGEATLGAAYKVLVQHWQQGNRDRDVELHLMFLSWYLMVEPPYCTGLDGSSPIASGLPAQFKEVHTHFAEPLKDDAPDPDSDPALTPIQLTILSPSPDQDRAPA